MLPVNRVLSAHMFILVLLLLLFSSSPLVLFSPSPLLLFSPSPRRYRTRSSSTQSRAVAVPSTRHVPSKRHTRRRIWRRSSHQALHRRGAAPETLAALAAAAAAAEDREEGHRPIMANARCKLSMEGGQQAVRVTRAGRHAARRLQVEMARRGWGRGWMANSAACSHGSIPTRASSESTSYTASPARRATRSGTPLSCSMH